MIKPVLVIVKKYFVILYIFIFLTVARIVRASKVATRTSVVKATKNTHLYKNTSSQGTLTLKALTSPF